MKISKVAEVDIEIALEKFFCNIESDVKVKRQVYYGGKRIDLIIYSENASSAIEVKLSDWRGALRQASLNKTACEESYVAMWHKQAASALDNIKEFAANKVGLIIVDNNKDPVVFYAPVANSVFLPQAKASMQLCGVI